MHNYFMHHCQINKKIGYSIMPNIYFSSDYHFGHTNVLNFDKRPFKNLDEMHETIISNHNEIVTNDDILYILGDVSMKLDHIKVAEILNKMNGKKILIKGNHDKGLLRHPEFRNCFESIHDYLEIKHNHTMLCLFHYPIDEWNATHRGSIHLYGHTHTKEKELNGKALNVGIMNHNFYPLSLKDIFEKTEKMSVGTHYD